MSTQNRDVRSEILEAAERCFYNHGITATGVDTLAEEANVSKRTLYNHFGSKDEVIAAYMQRRVDRWKQRLANPLEGAQDPLERLFSYVEEYCWFSAEDGYRGCAYINAAADLDDDHPAMSIIRDSLSEIEAGLAAILEDVGVRDPDGLATQLLVVLEGALSVAGMRRSAGAWATARQLVTSLVEAHLPDSGDDGDR